MQSEFVKISLTELDRMTDQHQQRSSEAKDYECKLLLDSKPRHYYEVGGVYLCQIFYNKLILNLL